MRGVVTRAVSAAGALIVALVMMAGFAPAAAQAAPRPAVPKPAVPTAVQIAGKGLDGGKVVIQKKDRAELFGRLLSEVSWLSTATPQTTAPKADRLGPKYTVTVLIKDAPNQVYDLYPLAAGGPRAHRPAKQPAGKKLDGWFYGRLTMPESLRIGGVPLEATVDVTSGGIGGGVGENVKADEIDAMASVNNFLGEMRRLFLLNGAVLVVILCGLAGIAFMIRRRV